jgi:hypothetical protein
VFVQALVRLVFPWLCGIVRRGEESDERLWLRRQRGASRMNLKGTRYARWRTELAAQFA